MFKYFMSLWVIYYLDNFGLVGVGHFIHLIKGKQLILINICQSNFHPFCSVFVGSIPRVSTLDHMF